jgi:hypothetical protein
VVTNQIHGRLVVSEDQANRRAVGGVAKMQIVTIAASYAAFEQNFMPDDTTADHRECVRSVFYAGAATIMGILTSAPTKERSARARALIDELRHYADHVKADGEQPDGD